ncbi:MAG: hypothetical protein ACI828_002518 [Flavobacteriales bacterium]|jgi:hypothetical protein
MKYIAFIVVLLCISCSSDDLGEDCSTVLCASQNLMLQFVSADTGVDVFGAGVLDARNLVIRDIDSGTTIFYEVISIGSNQDVLIAFTGAIDTAVTNYKVSYEDVFELDIAFEMIIVSGSACCAQISYKNVIFSGLEGEASDEFLDTYVVQF